MPMQRDDITLTADDHGAGRAAAERPPLPVDPARAARPALWPPADRRLEAQGAAMTAVLRPFAGHLGRSRERTHAVDPDSVDVPAIRRHFVIPGLGRVVTNNAASTQLPGELLELYQSLAAG